MAHSERRKDGIWETLKTIFWALVIAGTFRTVFFQPFSIPSGSMKPTLLVGDYLFVTKYSYGYSKYSLPFEPDWFDGRIWSAIPERGDVVVFKHPKLDSCTRTVFERVTGFFSSLRGRAQVVEDDCVDYVKRLIGLPGDTIQVKGGILHINGVALPTVATEPFVEPKIALGNPPRNPRCVNEPVAPGGACVKEQFIETLPGGKTHPVLNISGTVGQPNPTGGLPDDSPEYTVPEGQFFFMGDNRDNSVDSRFLNAVGFVPFDNLIGRADLIAISSEGPFWQVWNWRVDRLIKSID